MLYICQTIIPVLHRVSYFALILNTRIVTRQLTTSNVSDINVSEVIMAPKHQFCLLLTNLLSLFSAQELIKPPAEEEQTEMESFDGRVKSSIILLDKEVIREVEDANHTQVPSSFRRVKQVRSNKEDCAPMV